MKNKKGDSSLAWNNLLSVLIAIAGLVLLGFAFVKLYDAAVNSETKNAQNVLDNIKGKIDNLEDGQAGKFMIPGFSGAEKWYLIGFNANDNNRPDKCFFESCLCICKNENFELSWKDACQDKGFCRMFGDKILYASTGRFVKVSSDLKVCGDPDYVSSFIGFNDKSMIIIDVLKGHQDFYATGQGSRIICIS